MNTHEQGLKRLAALRFSCLCATVVFIGGSLFICGCRPKHPPAPATSPAPATTQVTATVDEAMALIDQRAPWTDLPPVNVPRYPGEQFLKGLTIVLDPGHGGTDGGYTSTKPAGYKAGPGGEKEAYINLRVALLLERLLKDAGVNVVMTRHGDDTIGLAERAEVANNVKRPDGGIGADLFVSIHHNAGSRTSNYPSVWYHGGVDDNEMDMDVARYIAYELGIATRTQVGKTSPIFSSQLMYPGGFGVLRACKVPGVLLECSFFSVPEEELKLRDPVYNLREAYGIYLGLAQWAYSGRPRQTTPQITRAADGQFQLIATLDEGLPNWWGSDRNRILSSTVQVTLDEAVIPSRFEALPRKLTATLPASVAGGRHVLTIHHVNFLKNSNWPQRYELKADAGGQISVESLPSRRPNSQPATRAVARP